MTVLHRILAQEFVLVPPDSHRRMVFVASSHMGPGS